MLYIPKVDDYLKFLSDEEVKDFVAINFSEYFKSIKEEQNLRKVAKSLYIFLTTPDKVEKYLESNSSDNCIHRYNVEILNTFDPEFQLINSKPMIKNKLKEFLSEFKKFKVWVILVFKTIRNEMIVKSSIRLLLIQALLKHLNPCIKASMTKIKNYTSKDWI